MQRHGTEQQRQCRECSSSSISKSRWRFPWWPVFAVVVSAASAAAVVIGIDQCRRTARGQSPAPQQPHGPPDPAADGITTPTVGRRATQHRWWGDFTKTHIYCRVHNKTTPIDCEYTCTLSLLWLLLPGVNVTVWLEGGECQKHIFFPEKVSSVGGLGTKSLSSRVFWISSNQSDSDLGVLGILLLLFLLSMVDSTYTVPHLLRHRGNIPINMKWF